MHALPTAHSSSPLSLSSQPPMAHIRPVGQAFGEARRASASAKDCCAGPHGMQYCFAPSHEFRGSNEAWSPQMQANQCEEISMEMVVVTIAR